MCDLAGKRIIVTFLMHLGDLTLTTPFLRVLRKAAPGAHITYLVDEKLQDVVLNNPNIDEVMTIDKKGKDDSVRALYSVSQKISAGNFDILINLQPNERCSFICACAHVPKKVGVSHFLFKSFFALYLSLNRKLHAADMYVDVLARLGVKDLSNKGLEIFLGQEQIQVVEKFWQQQGLLPEDKLVGFNIGSAVETKRWSPERFAQVADVLAQDGYKIIFFGGSMDKAMVAKATARLKGKPIIATGKFTIGQLAAAMSRCSLIITNDSGPMHVAISQKVPIVAMYGPSSPTLYGPYTKRATIVTAVSPCIGCATSMKHHCDDMQCMDRLEVTQVLEAAYKWLR